MIVKFKKRLVVVIILTFALLVLNSFCFLSPEQAPSYLLSYFSSTSSSSFSSSSSPASLLPPPSHWLYDYTHLDDLLRASQPSSSQSSGASSLPSSQTPSSIYPPSIVNEDATRILAETVTQVFTKNRVDMSVQTSFHIDLEYHRPNYSFYASSSGTSLIKHTDSQRMLNVFVPFSLKTHKGISLNDRLSKLYLHTKYWLKAMINHNTVHSQCSATSTTLSSCVHLIYVQLGGSASHAEVVVNHKDNQELIDSFVDYYHFANADTTKSIAFFSNLAFFLATPAPLNMFVKLEQLANNANLFTDLLGMPIPQLNPSPSTSSPSSSSSSLLGKASFSTRFWMPLNAFNTTTGERHEGAPYSLPIVILEADRVDELLSLVEKDSTTSLTLQHLPDLDKYSHSFSGFSLLRLSFTQPLCSLLYASPLLVSYQLMQETGGYDPELLYGYNNPISCLSASASVSGSASVPSGHTPLSIIAPIDAASALLWRKLQYLEPLRPISGSISSSSSSGNKTKEGTSIVLQSPIWSTHVFDTSARSLSTVPRTSRPHMKTANILEKFVTDHHHLRSYWMASKVIHDFDCMSFRQRLYYLSLKHMNFILQLAAFHRRPSSLSSSSSSSQPSLINAPSPTTLRNQYQYRTFTLDAILSHAGITGSSSSLSSSSSSASSSSSSSLPSSSSPSSSSMSLIFPIFLLDSITQSIQGDEEGQPKLHLAKDQVVVRSGANDEEDNIVTSSELSYTLHDFYQPSVITSPPPSLESLLLSTPRSSPSLLDSPSVYLVATKLTIDNDFFIAFTSSATESSVSEFFRIDFSIRDIVKTEVRGQASSKVGTNQEAVKMTYSSTHPFNDPSVLPRWNQHDSVFIYDGFSEIHLDQRVKSSSSDTGAQDTDNHEKIFQKMNEYIKNPSGEANARAHLLSRSKQKTSKTIAPSVLSVGEENLIVISVDKCGYTVFAALSSAIHRGDDRFSSAYSLPSLDTSEMSELLHFPHRLPYNQYQANHDRRQKSSHPESIEANSDIGSDFARFHPAQVTMSSTPLPRVKQQAIHEIALLEKRYVEMMKIEAPSSINARMLSKKLEKIRKFKPDHPQIPQWEQALVKANFYEAALKNLESRVAQLESSKQSQMLKVFSFTVKS